MTTFQITSIGEPMSTDAATSVAAARLAARVHYLGLLPLSGPHKIDRAFLLLMFTKLSEVGVARSARVLLKQASDVSDYRTLLEATIEQTENSPLPSTEWKPVAETLGETLLAELLRISASSVRRYAAGVRATPDDVATRLHFIALLVADLSGSYNDYGTRRWFERPRAALDGRSPRELLGADFDPDRGEASRLRQLAAGLIGAGAT